MPKYVEQYGRALGRLMEKVEDAKASLETERKYLENSYRNGVHTPFGFQAITSYVARQYLLNSYAEAVDTLVKAVGSSETALKDIDKNPAFIEFNNNVDKISTRSFTEEELDDLSSFSKNTQKLLTGLQRAKKDTGEVVVIPEEHLFPYIIGVKELTDEVIEKEAAGTLKEELAAEIAKEKEDEVQYYQETVEESLGEDEKKPDIPGDGKNDDNVKSEEENKKEADEPEKENKVEEGAKESGPESESAPEDSEKLSEDVIKELDNELGDLGREWGKPYTEEEIQKLKDMADLDLGKNISSESMSIYSYLTEPVPAGEEDGKPIDSYEVYIRAGFAANREDTAVAVFKIWLMGQKNLSVEQVAAISDKQVIGEDGQVKNQKELDELANYKKEFVQFCADNAVKGENNSKLDDKTVEKSIKSWTNVLQNATEQLKKYRLPEINYGDHKEIREHLPNLYAVQSMAINFGQEYDRIIGNHPQGKQMSFDAMGGEENDAAMRQVWWNAQMLFGGSLTSGYTESIGNSNSAENVMAGVKNIAAGRVVCELRLNPLGGKTMEEVDKKFGINGTMEFSLQKRAILAVKGDDTMGMEPVPGKVTLAYLTGKDTKTLKTTIGQIFREADKEARQVLVQSQYNALWSFRRYREPNERDEALLAIPDDNPQAMKDYLENPDNLNRLNALYNKSVLDNQSKEIQNYMGIQTSELFLIDGKKPEELWGDKYKDVTDKKQKETLYRLEIYKSALKGDAKIQCRVFGVDTNGEYYEEKPVLLFDTKENMEKLPENLARMDAGMKSFMIDTDKMAEELSKTQDVPTNNFNGNRKEGSDYYKDMVEALQKCRKALSDEYNHKRDYSDKEIESFIKDYKEKCQIYHEKRKGLFARPFTDRGKQRLKLSEKGVVLADRMMSEYKRLKAGISGDLMCSPRGETLTDATYDMVSKEVRNLQETGFCGEKNAEKAEKEYAKEQGKKVNTLNLVIDPIEGDLKPEEYENAKRVILGIHFEKTKENETFDLYDLSRINNFEENVRELAENPTFNRMYQQLGEEETIRLWPDIEQDMRDIKAQCEKDLEAMQQYHDGVSVLDRGLDEYIADIKPEGEYAVGETPKITPEEAIREAAANPDKLHACYQRLAEVTLTKYLAEDGKTGKHMLGEMTQNSSYYTDLLDYTTKLCESKHILEGKNISKVLEQTIRGKFGQDLVKVIKEKGGPYEEKEVGVYAQIDRTKELAAKASVAINQEYKERQKQENKEKEPLKPALGKLLSDAEASKKILSGMKEGYLKEDGSLWEEKIRSFIKVAALEAIRARKDKFNTSEDVEKLEKKWLTDSQTKKVLLTIAKEHSGDELVELCSNPPMFKHEVVVASKNQDPLVSRMAEELKPKTFEPGKLVKNEPEKKINMQGGVKAKPHEENKNQEVKKPQI